MLKNFLLTAFRTFFRNKTFSLLGILGLTLSISCVIAIYTIINFQGSFDKHQKNYDDVYRALSHIKQGDQEGRYATVPHPLSEGLRGKLTGVSAISNTYLMSAQLSMPTSSGVPKKIQQRNIGFVEPDITKILTFQWLAGGPRFDDQTYLCISREVAEKFFGVNGNYETILGKELTLANAHRLIISGVYQDLPKSTDYPFKVMTAYHNQDDVNPYFSKGKQWGSLNGGTECLLKVEKGANLEDIKASMSAIFEEHKIVDEWFLDLQPFSTIHYLPYGNYSGTAFEKTYVIMSYAMMFFLSLIGCINFINLSTARAINRSKEVGVRKIMGGSRIYLILQFLTESFVIVLIALGFGFLIADQILAGFNYLIDGDLSLNDVRTIDWTFFCLTTLGVLTLMSGLYPALLLSGFSPLHALKVKASNIDRQSRLPIRKILVGLQFAFSIALIFSTAVMFYQINFLKNHDVGFKSDGIVNLRFAKVDQEKQEVLKRKLLTMPQVESVSLCVGSPMANGNNTGKYYNPEVGKDVAVAVNNKTVDEDYIDLFKLKLLAGRGLFANDREVKNAVVNLKLLEELKLGTPQEALGKTVKHILGDTDNYKIVGVIDDFHARSLQEDIKPVMLYHDPEVFDEAAIQLRNHSKEELVTVMEGIKKTWDEVYPDDLISYNFLEESLARFYKFEDVMAQSISFFVLIAIIVSSMGLYGLTDYIANARRKEFGIRKVVGANLWQLIMAFVREVVPILLVAFAISGTLSFYLMREWLAQFSYQIAIGWQIGLLTFLATLGLVVVAMGYRSFLAAKLNPVNVLKDE